MAPAAEFKGIGIKYYEGEVKAEEEKDGQHLALTLERSQEEKAREVLYEEVLVLIADGSGRLTFNGKEVVKEVNLSKKSPILTAVNVF